MSLQHSSCSESDDELLRVAFSIVDPLGGSQSFVVGAPVEETGVDVQRVQQVGGGPDHPETTNLRLNQSTHTEQLHVASPKDSFCGR